MQLLAVAEFHATGFEGGSADGDPCLLASARLVGSCAGKDRRTRSLAASSVLFLDERLL